MRDKTEFSKGEIANAESGNEAGRETAQRAQKLGSSTGAARCANVIRQVGFAARVLQPQAKRVHAKIGQFGEEHDAGQAGQTGGRATGEFLHFVQLDGGGYRV